MRGFYEWSHSAHNRGRDVSPDREVNSASRVKKPKPAVPGVTTRPSRESLLVGPHVIVSEYSRNKYVHRMEKKDFLFNCRGLKFDKTPQLK